jgi:hypothetical protein
LFPYRYGGMGILHGLVRVVLHTWEDLRLAFGNALAWIFRRRIPKNPTDPQTP